MFNVLPQELTMRRSPELVHLSREHHAALVQAKRIKGSNSSTDVLEVWPSVAFLTELEAHFDAEETMFAQYLVHLPRLAGQFSDDHKTLRALMRQLHAGKLAALLAFGERLEAHVRFEERELFPALEGLIHPA
ncbi:hemerythrin domain-containing protein [Craterilacuibacter sp. RT1T]|uniref:hemerythrin domain-containing protein n=1 Tax=Craterilacuibacter sp. RT1T TaxID=2942211 RepID=UPI0020BF79B9|nr:hemerythrin domain-containing protein [Craterilacuibacter sp. RT1T]MCL6264715.1 hemerythrin domain-containing protein [Craterilacuibacter sp. RT1T]